MRGLSFTDFQRFTRNMPVELRLDLFAGFPAATQDEFWAELGREWQAQRIYEEQQERYVAEVRGILGEDPPNLHSIKHALRPKPEPPPFLEHLGRTIEKRQAIDDALAAIPAADYIEQIARVRADRKVIFCPLPEHDDSRTPNFYIYEHNWRCYACGAQGRIYQFAGLMWGYTLPLRGRAFNEVFERLCSVFRLD